MRWKQSQRSKKRYKERKIIKMLFLVDSNPDNKNIDIFEKYHKLIFLSMIKRMKKIKTKNTKNINEKKMKKIQNKNRSLNK